MKFLTEMTGVRTSCGNYHAKLWRNDEGRLIMTGGGIDIFDLVLWLDNNPLAQFREIKSDGAEKFEPSEPFKHLFNEDGTVK